MSKTSDDVSIHATKGITNVAVHAEVKSLTEELRKVTTNSELEVQQLNLALSRHQRECEEKEKAIQALTTLLGESQAEVAKLNLQLTEAIDAKATLTTTMRNQEELLIRHASAFEVVKVEAETLQSLLRAVQEKDSEVNRMFTELRDVNVTLKTEKESLQQSLLDKSRILSGAQAELDTVKAQLVHATMVQEMCVKKVKANEFSNEVLNASMQDVMKVKSALEKDNQGLMEEVRLLKELCEKKDAELGSAMQCVQELQQRVVQLTTKNSSTPAPPPASSICYKSSSWKSDTAVLQQQLQEERSRKNEFAAQVVVLTEQCASLAAELHTLRLEETEHAATLRDVQTKYDTSEKETQRRISQCDKLTQENEELSKNVKSISIHSQHVEMESERLRRVNDTLSAELRSQVVQVNELQSALQSAITTAPPPVSVSSVSHIKRARENVVVDNSAPVTHHPHPNGGDMIDDAAAISITSTVPSGMSGGVHKRKIISRVSLH